MPGKIVVHEDSYLAASDLSTKQFYLVKLTAENTMDLCTAATDFPIGVLQDSPKAGEMGRVMRKGRTKAAVDGTTDIAVTDLLGPNSSSVLVKKATNDYVFCAQALQPFTANNVGYVDVEIGDVRFYRSPAG